MLKPLRLGLNKAFHVAVCERWPMFVPVKAPSLVPKYSGEYLLEWVPHSQLKLLWSVYPNPKTEWSSFGISLLWSRSGNFTFDSGRPNLRQQPPNYNIGATLRRGLELEVVDFSMYVLRFLDYSEETGWVRTKFQTFDDSYSSTWFPLLSPIHTFDPKTQGPADYQRLEEEERRFSIDNGTALASPIVDELIQHAAQHVWPFVEGELIPVAAAKPWNAG